MGHQHTHSATKNISTAFFLNLFFTIVEIIGGFYTNSVAIVSDAVHDLGDSLSLGMSWYLEKKSNQKATKKYSYGYKRFSLLGAIINSIVLLIGSFFIIIESVPRLFNPQNADAKGMMWFALFGIIVNGAAVLKLKKGTSLNEKVASWHLLEDVMGWVAVLIASILMQFYDIPILDPILSLGIASFILFNVFKNGKESVQIILQGTPKSLSVEEIKTSILKNNEVKSLDNCRLWTLDGEHHIFTATLVLKDGKISLEKSNVIKQQIKKDLQHTFQLEQITLELEN